MSYLLLDIGSLTKRLPTPTPAVVSTLHYSLSLSLSLSIYLSIYLSLSLSSLSLSISRGSSTDLLSPEPMDAFSPPLTPSLTTSLTNIPGDSLPSPSHVPHRLSYEANPYLHPKYLLADFALPRKKVKNQDKNFKM